MLFDGMCYVLHGFVVQSLRRRCCWWCAQSQNSVEQANEVVKDDSESVRISKRNKCFLRFLAI